MIWEDTLIGTCSAIGVNKIITTSFNVNTKMQTNFIFVFFSTRWRQYKKLLNYKDHFSPKFIFLEKERM